MNNFYNPYYGQFGQQFQPQIQQPQTTQDERIWVQNETSAEAYLVAPNSFVRLWDSNDSVFYEKRADANGRPLPMEAFRYTRISPKTEILESAPTVDYRKEIDALNERITALESKGAKKNAKSNDDDTAV